MDRVDPIVALLVFAIVVVLLFVIVTRGARALLGPRRRLEEGVGLAVLEGRLRRGEISQEEFDRASEVVSSEVRRTG
ncbi:MAG: hypothetical protein QOI37_1855 [Chloroflexota bacterium]|nr:hypothetical protein [Chloroflexota bacterium]